MGNISLQEVETMNHTKTKSAPGSRPLCFYLHPMIAKKLAEIAAEEGRPFYRQAAQFIENGIKAYSSTKRIQS